MSRSVIDFLNSANAAVISYEKAHLRVENLTLQLKKLERSGQTGVNAQDLKDRLEKARLLELEAVRKEMRQYHAVSEFIEQLPTAVMRSVMRYRYLFGLLSWHDISRLLAADGRGMSERNVFRVHAKAVKIAQKKWDELDGNLQQNGRS